MNLRKEGFIPINGPSSFDFISPMKDEISRYFMFREFEMTKKTIVSFFCKLSPRGTKKYKMMPRGTLLVEIN